MREEPAAQHFTTSPAEGTGRTGCAELGCARHPRVGIPRVSRPSRPCRPVLSAHARLAARAACGTRGRARLSTTPRSRMPHRPPHFSTIIRTHPSRSRFHSCTIAHAAVTRSMCGVRTRGGRQCIIVSSTVSFQCTEAWLRSLPAGDTHLPPPPPMLPMPPPLRIACPCALLGSRM